MEVQTVNELSSLLPRSDLSSKLTGLKQQTITARQTVTITVEPQAGIYRADSAIFSKEATILPYSQLAEIEQALQQTDAKDSNRENNRVISGASPIAGFGAFAKRPYQQGEIIGFYTGNLVLRKPMPDRLITRYQRLTKKKWRDMVLPLYSIWQQNPTGSVQYQTGADTYIAWSQVKIYNKGIELGIDGEHSGNPLRLLNHSHEPNTTLLPTVNPKMLQHIRADGQTYVKADANLAQCLLIPVLALRAIERDTELTFHYRGQGRYSSYSYNFAETGKDIVSNPEVMMTQKPGGFPEYIRAPGRGHTARSGKGPGIEKGGPLSQPPQGHRETPIGSIPAPVGADLLTGSLTNPGIIIHDLCLPLSPIRLDQESDRDFSARVEQLINRSRQPTPMASVSPGPSGVTSTRDQEQRDWDSDRESGTSEEQSITDSEDEFSPYEHWGSEADSPLDLDDSSEDEPAPIVSTTGQEGDNLAPSHSMTTPRSRKRSAPGRSKYALRDKAGWVQRKQLFQRLETAGPHEHPDIIWKLFSTYHSAGFCPLISSYNQLCAVLNTRAIPHDIEGEEPEWVPPLVYYYFVNHGYIDGQSQTEKYRLMPVSVLKQRIVDNKDESAPDQIEQFALQWLWDHHFHCCFLARGFNSYGLKQRDGSPWDLAALYGLLTAHPLSDQELTNWLAGVTDNQALGIGLWNLTRAGNERAFHALVQSYFAKKNHNINLIVRILNKRLRSHKGLFNIATPLSQATLLQYIIKHDILDLDNNEIFNRLVPWEMHSLIDILTPVEKQKLAYKGAASSQTDREADQIQEKLFRDFISDSPEQRDLNLAKNLLHLYQVKRSNSWRQKGIYNSLAALLKRHGVHTVYCPKWSEQAIYDFWLSQGVLDGATKYSVMSFKHLQTCFRQAEDPEKQLAHFFHQWIKVREPQTCIRQLRDHKITHKGTPYTVTRLFDLIAKYDLPFLTKDLSQYQVNTDLEMDRSLQDLPVLIRQYKDKEALKKYIEQWLIRFHNRQQSGLSKIARYIKEALKKKDKDDQEDPLKQFSDAFNGEVWTPEGLVKFIRDEGILDFSNPESFSYLAPAEAGLILPDAYCLDYVCYAIAKGVPAGFIAAWESRWQKAYPECSPAVFYGALGQHLASNPPVFPYTHEQIKSLYRQVHTQNRQQLKTLLKLETLQFQAVFGCQQSPDSLLILIGLLRTIAAKNMKNVIIALQNFQIKIPKDVECLETSDDDQVSPSGETSEDPETLQGRADTINWVKGNVHKLLALHDQKLKGRPNLDSPTDMIHHRQ